ncbi:MAG: ACT domain-containing protein [Saprospiraceae bacterium]|nr:ACT domain-containing protein [Saprospiraceae bacterium]
MQGVSDLKVLISSMKPISNNGQYVFCSVQNMDFDWAHIVLFFKEKEGFTVVCTPEYALQKAWIYDSIFAWITLSVHSSLNAVGLTAAFSRELAENGISCNVVAAYFHDHIFVPYEKGGFAIQILEKMSHETL